MSNLARNMLWNVVGQGVTVALGFLAVKFVYARLGKDAVGIIYFTLTVSSVLTLALDLGISSTVVREVSARFARDPAYVSALMRTGTLLYWGAWAALAVVLWLSAPWLVQRWIHLETLDARTAVGAVRVLGLGALLILPRSIYMSL